MGSTSPPSTAVLNHYHRNVQCSRCTLRVQPRTNFKKCKQAVRSGVIKWNDLHLLPNTVGYLSHVRTLAERRTTRQKVKLVICDVAHQGGKYKNLIGIPVSVGAQLTPIEFQHLQERDLEEGGR